MDFPSTVAKVTKPAKTVSTGCREGGLSVIHPVAHSERDIPSLSPESIASCTSQIPPLRVGEGRGRGGRPVPAAPSRFPASRAPPLLPPETPKRAGPGQPRVPGAVGERLWLDLTTQSTSGCARLPWSPSEHVVRRSQPLHRSLPPWAPLPSTVYLAQAGGAPSGTRYELFSRPGCR